MKLHYLTATVLALAAGTAQADGLAKIGDCDHVYKKPPPVRKSPPKKPPVKPPVVVVNNPPSCVCHGQKGDNGDKGDTGTPGLQGPPGERGPAGYAAIGIRLGVMGSGSLPHKDWAWGPALQLTAELNQRVELAIDAGLALPINWAGSPGRESGVLAHVGLARYFNDGRSPLGLTVGIHYTGINGSSANGDTTGHRLAVDGGVVLRKSWKAVNVRFEVAPAIGGLRGNDEPDHTRFTIGLTSSAFVGVNW